MQVAGRDGEHDGAAAAGSDTARRPPVAREVDVMSAAPLEAVRDDRLDEALGRPVLQRLRRRDPLEPEVDGDAVALVRADPAAVGVEGEALLVVARDDLVELG